MRLGSGQAGVEFALLSYWKHENQPELGASLSGKPQYLTNHGLTASGRTLTKAEDAQELSTLEQSQGASESTISFSRYDLQKDGCLERVFESHAWNASRPNLRVDR